jgi:hypothetical protein
VYDYRNRWYLPEAGVFGERDPVGFKNSESLFAFLGVDPPNLRDPIGLDWAEFVGVAIVWYEGKPGDRSRSAATYPATSGLFYKDPNGHVIDYQHPKYTGVKGMGPIPAGRYRINLVPDPHRMAKVNGRTGELYWNPRGGIERIPETVPAVGQPGYEWRFDGWGTIRALLTPSPRNDMKGRYPADRFYVHNSHKGYTHGCVETSNEFFNRLLAYRSQHPEQKQFHFFVRYTGSSTRGATERSGWPALANF